jgi:hypothetical protein
MYISIYGWHFLISLVISRMKTTSKKIKYHLISTPCHYAENINDKNLTSIPGLCPGFSCLTKI